MDGASVARRPVVGTVVAGLTCFALVLGRPAPASPEQVRSIEVGAVSSAATRAGPRAVGELRRALEGAARSMGPSRGAAGPLVLAGSVTRLDEERVGGRLRFRCEVSLIVLGSPGGQMRAVLTGRAMSEGGIPRSRDELEGLEADVVGSAARSALDRLATVIDRI